MVTRETMLDKQMRARGLKDKRVLAAMGSVHRERFLPPELAEFAYEDAPLPIAEGQTISQPYVVAVMLEAAEIGPGDRVLEVGTGSGYAAACAGALAREVHTIERHPALARGARAALENQGFSNVHVHEGDGTQGWAPAAPYDAIIVTAGGPRVPASLRRQLKIGGRLVIPVGEMEDQRLQRVVRRSESEFETQELGRVRFVPLVGEEGWALPAAGQRPTVRPQTLAERLALAAEPFESIAQVDVSGWLGRVGDARVVLLGEASHGTSEFYTMRARLTKDLIIEKGFTVLALEADWPDARLIDRYVRGQEQTPWWEAFARFPTWMWRNQEMHDFVEWLRDYNRHTDRPVGVYGLDIYSLNASIQEVLKYLERVSPEAAEVARVRYGCLSPWQKNPQLYGEAVLRGTYRSCEDDVVKALLELLKQRPLDEGLFDARRNAQLVQAAESFYRVMYYGSNASWNLRDEHMMETLEALLSFTRGRAVVWAHNSHIGDARATEMGARGQLNLGQLCRERLAGQTYHVGFGTHRGTVAAATDWEGPMERKTVRDSRAGSYEHLFHATGLPRFLLPLEKSAELRRPRLERAIGVIYRPDTELMSHYFEARLSDQFDELVWFDETTAVTPLPAERTGDALETFPTGL